MVEKEKGKKISRRVVVEVLRRFLSLSFLLMSSVPSLGQKRIIVLWGLGTEAVVLRLSPARATRVRVERVSNFDGLEKLSGDKKVARPSKRPLLRNSSRKRKEQELARSSAFVLRFSFFLLLARFLPSMATAACRASSAAGASCSGNNSSGMSSRSSSFCRAAVSSSSSKPSAIRPLSRRFASPLPSSPSSSSRARVQAMGIGLGEEVGDVPTGRRIVLPGEDENQQRRAFRPTFHSSPLLDPDFDIPKSHYGLTLKQMESLGLHEHALLNGSPNPVSLFKTNDDAVVRANDGDDDELFFCHRNFVFLPSRAVAAFAFLPMGQRQGKDKNALEARI